MFRQFVRKVSEGTKKFFGTTLPSAAQSTAKFLGTGLHLTKHHLPRVTAGIQQGRQVLSHAAEQYHQSNLLSPHGKQRIKEVHEFGDTHLKRLGEFTGNLHNFVSRLA